MTDAAAIEGGFADPVFEAQTMFRAVMDALARPGTLQAIGAAVRPPAPMTAGLAAVALTLCDPDSPVWLDAGLAAVPAVADWLRFQTGAPITADPGTAMFALIADGTGLPALDRFALGSDEYPDRSTTLIIAVDELDGGQTLHLSGPGIETTARLAPRPLADHFAAQWRDNRHKFPRGVDVIFVAPGWLAGLPRSTRIRES